MVHADDEALRQLEAERSKAIYERETQRRLIESALETLLPKSTDSLRVDSTLEVIFLVCVAAYFYF